jgi:hypothetical protein
MIKKLSLIATVLLMTVAGAAIVFQNARAQQRDNIEYNAVYDCGSGRLKFKVISCKGTGRLDRCEVFYINEHSPNGGFKDSNSRGQIDDSIKQGCKTKNQSAVKNEPEGNEQRESATPVSKNAPTSARDETGIVACAASSSDSDGKSANEKTFRGVIRRLWEKEASAGSDGAVTLTFQKVVVGAPRAWRPTATDAYSQADPRKPIYPVRATFATCTDYKTAIAKRKMERIYDCFVHKTGGWQCTQTGASGPLATKDEKEYLPKKR